MCLREQKYSMVHRNVPHLSFVWHEILLKELIIHGYFQLIKILLAQVTCFMDIWKIFRMKVLSLKLLLVIQNAVILKSIWCSVNLGDSSKTWDVSASHSRVSAVKRGLLACIISLTVGTTGSAEGKQKSNIFTSWRRWNLLKKYNWSLAYFTNALMFCVFPWFLAFEINCCICEEWDIHI